MQEIDILGKDVSSLQTKIAVLEKEIEHMKQQLESREVWLRGIGIAVVAAVLVWFGQNALDSHSAQKANSVGVSTSKAK